LLVVEFQIGDSGQHAGIWEALVDVVLAVDTVESSCALAGVVSDAVNTHTIVFAWASCAIIDVDGAV
jgi:hypothetical protein